MNSQQLPCVQIAHNYSSKCSWLNLGQLIDNPLANPVEIQAQQLDGGNPQTQGQKCILCEALGVRHTQNSEK